MRGGFGDLKIQRVVPFSLKHSGIQNLWYFSNNREEKARTKGELVGTKKERPIDLITHSNPVAMI